MRRIKIIYILLSAALCFCFPVLLFALGPDAYKVATQTEAREKRGPTEIERPLVEYKSAGAKDPFILYVDEKNTAKTMDETEVTTLPADITLRGIVWGGKFNQAIIKNKIVKVGDTIGEVSILDITQNGVSVFYKGRKFELASPAQEKMNKLKKKVGGKDEK